MASDRVGLSTAFSGGSPVFLHGTACGMPCDLLVMTLGRLFAFQPDFLHFRLGQMLDSDEMVVPSGNPDQFVQLDLDSGAVAILRILDQEHHEEGDDCRTG